MKRAWILTFLGVLAFLIFLVATLPARVLLDRIPNLAATGVSGTLWSGSASSISVQGQPIGALDWTLQPLPLFLGRADLAAELKRADGTAVARCAARLSGRVSCNHVIANLPIEALPLSALPRGWTGRVDANFSELVVEDNWPVAARGTLLANDVTQPNGTVFGSYRVDFPAATSEPAPERTLVGAIQDSGGPLEIAGLARFQPDRTYEINAKVAARPEASQSIARALEYLGPADPSGRRDFSMSGTF